LAARFSDRVEDERRGLDEPGRARFFVLPLAVVTLLAGVGGAHQMRAEQVVELLGTAAVREQFDIRSARRDPKLPRLLVIRVGPGWSALPPERRRAAAEEWLHLWTGDVPGGIVAVLDSASDAPLVNFDADGHAVLRSPSPAATGRPSAR
jgi:hypothetical protein